MAMILAVPFEFGPDGAARVVEQTAPEGVAQQIAVLVQTTTGERLLVPGFGITDPTWSDLDIAEVNAGLRLYGPPATVSAVSAEWLDNDTRRLTLEFA